MLARREGAAGYAIDEQFDPDLAMRAGQPHVIGRALVAERGRDRAVDRKGRVGEGDAQLRQRVGPFVAAMRHGA